MLDFILATFSLVDYILDMPLFNFLFLHDLTGLVLNLQSHSVYVYSFFTKLSKLGLDLVVPGMVHTRLLFWDIGHVWVFFLALCE